MKKTVTSELTKIEEFLLGVVKVLDYLDYAK